LRALGSITSLVSTVRKWYWRGCLRDVLPGPGHRCRKTYERARSVLVRRGRHASRARSERNGASRAEDQSDGASDDDASYRHPYIGPLGAATVPLMRDAVAKKRYPVIASVSASHTLLEIGREPEVSIGDLATLWGRADRDRRRVDRVRRVGVRPADASRRPSVETRPLAMVPRRAVVYTLGLPAGAFLTPCVRRPPRVGP
jgi:hypothetical protein